MPFEAATMQSPGPARHMRRREFIGLVGGVAAAWPLAAWAQQRTMPMIGFVSGRSPKDSVANVDAFRRGLAEADFAEGRNVAVQYRWAEGDYDRQPAFIAELIKHPVSVLAVFNIASALAAKKATATLPIVFGTSGDPRRKVSQLPGATFHVAAPITARVAARRTTAVWLE